MDWVQQHYPLLPLAKFNHLIILFNTFGEATVPLLLYKIDRSLFPVLKTFLEFLDRLPLGVLKNIPIDSYAEAELSQL